MASPTPAAAAHEDRDGPLPTLLLILTFVTGLVDAISYLKLDHVFVANMTGNVVFLGFAVAGAQDFSAPASLAAIAGFLVGALAGGRLGSTMGEHRGRYLAIAMLVQILFAGAALVGAMTVGDLENQLLCYALIILLALAMGVQNATARRLAVADLTTTVLTLTLTGFAADSTFAGGNNPRPGRRLMATFAMFLGAAVGAYLVLHVGVAPVLALTLALVVLNGVVTYRAWSSTEAWTVGAHQ